MDSLISFFESNDDQWNIDEIRNPDFIAIAEEFGYKFNLYKTSHEVAEFLKEQIKITIAGEDIKNKDFDKIRDHLALSYYSSGEKKFKKAFHFIELLRYTINRMDCYTSSSDAWIKARSYLEAYMSLFNYNYDIKFHGEYIAISNSIIFLNKKGYKCDIKLGEIILNEHEQERLFSAINYRLKKIGYNSILFTLAHMSPFFNNYAERFFLRSEPSQLGECKVDVPWGYLFNVSLANMHDVKKSKDHKRLFNELIELSENYFCAQRIQNFNKFSDINYGRDNILIAIQKNIFYDQFFSIDQISTKHIIKIISGLSKCSTIISTGIDMSIIEDILKLVSNKSRHDEPLSFTAEELYYGINCKHEFCKVKEIANALSLQKNEVNNGYLKPTELQRNNYYKKPFILKDEKYVYINPVICNYGFYFYLLNECNARGIDGNVIGKLTEELIGNLLTKSGIVFHGNKKYKITKAVANELNINSNERECDYIIETNKKIILIELKRKTLTTDARAGSTLNSIKDISQSLLHALAQAGCHEYMLRRDGIISFEDGTNIELLGRDVERVALSLFGFFSIQDGFFVSQILKILINSEIDAGDAKENIEINKYIIEIRNQYKTETFKNAYKDVSNFLNCRFFSVPQLIEILSNCSNNEEFKTELDRTRHIATGCKDWFKGYYYIRSIQKA